MEDKNTRGPIEGLREVLDVFAEQIVSPMVRSLVKKIDDSLVESMQDSITDKGVID